MLTFDMSASAFLYCGAVIGPATRLQDLREHLDGEGDAIPGQPDWSRFTTRGHSLNASISFYKDRVHSGYFWADVAGAASWDAVEQVEAIRRAAHEQIAARLFGAERFASDRISVSLAPDPRSCLEAIFFEFPGSV